MHAAITGASSGIGEATARRLAAAGARVTLIGRSATRLGAARDRIAAAVPDADLALEQADFADLAQVRALATRLSTGTRPDVVVSNAASVERCGADGLARMLTVNYLAPYLLLRTLASALDRARLIVVGSDPVLLAHEPVDLDDITFADPGRLGEPSGLWPYYAYARLKNMNTMFVYSLARRTAGTAVTVNGCHPGMIAGTGLGRDVPELGELLRQAQEDGHVPRPGPQPGVCGELVPEQLPGPDVGADTPAWLATSPAADGVTGRFYVDRVEVHTAPHTTDPQRCERLWQDSARLVGLSGD
ncbi:SDR family NAD(P)-dependent oxidoreductase [Nocardia suismassiliense]|uniref:SDR family NAD(P)-dependent oxidoreductase n=1 Tax=Nocardia suismassiliense TaxID=2077092 RepID=A0ABW6R145_9NOCA